MIVIHNPQDLAVPEYIYTLPVFLDYILEEHHQQDKEVSLVLCDDAYIQGLNKQYRGKDLPTDVLSFPAWEGDEEDLHEEDQSLGDIIISIDRCLAQSEEYGVSEIEEFARLAIHGCLHILGYDHETNKKDEKEMMDLQDKYLEEYLEEQK